MSLEDIQVGEYVKTDGFASKYHLQKVTKITKTQVVCGNTRFSKRSGRRVGGQTWDHNLYGEKATEQDLLIARGDRAKRAIDGALKDMSPELALQIAALIKAHHE